MGNRNSQDVLPYIPLFFPNDDDSEPQTKPIYSPNVEFTIIRTLLNLEKIKELLNLKDTIEDPLAKHKNAGHNCLNILKDLSELKETKPEVFDHDKLELLAKKVKGISPRFPDPDPLHKLLTLVHFSINSLSLLSEDRNQEKKPVGKAIKDLLGIMNWADLSEFDREIVSNYLYSDLFSSDLQKLDEQSANQRFQQVKSHLETSSLDIFNDPTKTPNFFFHIIRSFLFSSDSMPLDSEFEPIAINYKPVVFSAVSSSDLNLKFCAPQVLNLNSCLVRYYGLSHNVSFGSILPTNNISVQTKKIEVQVYYGVENPITTLFSYVASVQFQDQHGTLQNVSDFEKLTSTVGDLVNRVAELRPQDNNDYKTDFGFALLTEQNNWFYYTTNKDLPLNRMLDSSADGPVRIYFFPVKNSLAYNQPDSNHAIFVIKNRTQLGLFVETVDKSIDSIMGDIKKATGFEHLDSLELFSDQIYSKKLSGDNPGLPADGKSKLGSLKSMVPLSQNNSARKSSDPKPVDFVLTSTKSAQSTLENKWDSYSHSKFHLKIEPGQFFSTLLKTGIDWQSMKKHHIERVVRTTLPNLLFLEYGFLKKYVDVPVRFSIKFMADLCAKQNLQVPTSYNLQAMIARSSSGMYYDIYRKSLENNQLISFYEAEKKQVEDNVYSPAFIQNHLDLQGPSNKLQDDQSNEPTRETIQKTTSLDKINFSRVKYVIFQQTLAVR